MTIILKDLPKVSLNVWYSSKHWSFRKKLKDNYTLLVKSQFKNVLPASIVTILNTTSLLRADL